MDSMQVWVKCGQGRAVEVTVPKDCNVNGLIEAFWGKLNIAKGGISVDQMFISNHTTAEGRKQGRQSKDEGGVTRFYEPDALTTSILEIGVGGASRNPIIVQLSEKKIQVTFEGLNGPQSKRFTLTPVTWLPFVKGYHVKELRLPDDTSILDFEGLINGGEHRAICETDSHKHRSQVEDKILEVETGASVLRNVKEHFPDAHLHSNLKLMENEGIVLKEYDTVIHCHDKEHTIALLVEAKFNPRKTDVDELVKRAGELQKFINDKETFKLSRTGTLDIDSKLVPSHHFHNVKQTIPCLGGKMFHESVIEHCYSKNVAPIYPSGARYIAPNLATSLKAAFSFVKRAMK